MIILYSKVNDTQAHKRININKAKPGNNNMIALSGHTTHLISSKTKVSSDAQANNEIMKMKHNVTPY